MTTPQDPHSGQQPNASDPWQGGAPQSGGQAQQSGEPQSGAAPHQPGAPQPGEYPPPGAYPPPSTPTQPGTPPAGQYPPPGQDQQQPGQYQPPGAYPPPGTAPFSGQPGAPQPGQYPPPGTAPFPGQPAPGQPMPPMPGQVDEPAKKSNTPRIVIAVVVVLAVVLGGVLYFVNRQSDPAAASVGDCIKVIDASATDAELERLACDESDAMYTVTATGTSAECDPNEDVYTEKTDDGDLTTKLCLQPNVSDGECIQHADNGNALEKVDCAATKGDDEVAKVAKFDHTTSDESVCTGDSFPYVTYQTHPGVLCLTENN